jgi:phosphonoacetaldehyde hydrolase
MSTPFDYRGPVRLVVFDWAGTTIDHGCLAPVVPFQKAFQRYGVEITLAEARSPMGLDKMDHIRAILRMPGVAERWQIAYGRDATEAVVEGLFQQFWAFQMGVLPECSRLVPGLLDSVAWLRSRGVRIATTTGFFREAAEYVYEAGRQQGYAPDRNFCAEGLPEGRPAPYMMWRAMEALNVYPPAAVVKVGDTVPDIGEGRNAGAWTVAVIATGSELGLSEEEWNALSSAEQQQRAAAVRRTMLDAGAHFVIDSVADLPGLIPEIEERLVRGETP